MTPQITPKDIPQDNEDSEPEDDSFPVVMFGESSSDEEEVGIEVSQGYVPLPMDDGCEATVEFEQELENNSIDIEGEPQSSDSCDSCNEASSFRGDEQSTRETQLDTDQADLIRQVMCNITLPSSCIPEWAKVISEEKWKTSLVSSMQKRTDQEPDQGSSKEEPEQ